MHVCAGAFGLPRAVSLRPVRHLGGFSNSSEVCALRNQSGKQLSRGFKSKGAAHVGGTAPWWFCLKSAAVLGTLQHVTAG